MENNVEYLIEILDEQAVLFGESNAPEHQQEALRVQLTANCLRRYRDTLISIANCQGGVASHQAQDALVMTGHCGHFNRVFYSRNGLKDYWHCRDCDKKTDELMVPFE